MFFWFSSQTLVENVIRQGRERCPRLKNVSQLVNALLHLEVRIVLESLERHHATPGSEIDNRCHGHSSNTAHTNLAI